MRLTFLMRRRKNVLFSLPSTSGSTFGLWLQVGRTLQAGGDLRRPSVQPPAQSRLDSEFWPGCSGHCLAGPESRGPTASLWAAESSVWVVPHSGIPLAYQVRTSPDSVHGHHRSLSRMHIGKEPGSLVLAALPIGTDGRLCGPPEPSHLRAEQAPFPQPLLAGQVLQPPDCLGGPPLDSRQFVDVFLYRGAQNQTRCPAALDCI